MRRQLAPRGGDDLAFKLAPGRRGVAQHDFGRDERAGDRVRLGEDARGAHDGEAVERRLDLLGMHLGAADIDDAVAPADEMTTPVAGFDHVAGVDEALGVNQRRRVGAEQSQSAAWAAHAQGALDELHLDRA